MPKILLVDRAMCSQIETKSSKLIFLKSFITSGNQNFEKIHFMIKMLLHWNYFDFMGYRDLLHYTFFSPKNFQRRNSVPQRSIIK